MTHKRLFHSLFSPCLFLFVCLSLSLSLSVCLSLSLGLCLSVCLSLTIPLSLKISNLEYLAADVEADEGTGAPLSSVDFLAQGDALLGAGLSRQRVLETAVSCRSKRHKCVIRVIPHLLISWTSVLGQLPHGDVIGCEVVKLFVLGSKLLKAKNKQTKIR